MNKVIAYKKSDDNSIVLLYPNLNCGIPIEEIARKDVPSEIPYILINKEELPDYEFFDAFEADFTNPNGYGIGADAWFAEQEALNDNN
jgi:hypothetical protein